MLLDLHIQLWMNIKAEEDAYGFILTDVERKIIAEHFHYFCCDPVRLRLKNGISINLSSFSSLDSY